MRTMSTGCGGCAPGGGGCIAPGGGGGGICPSGACAHTGSTLAAKTKEREIACQRNSRHLHFCFILLRFRPVSDRKYAISNWVDFQPAASTFLHTLLQHTNKPADYYSSLRTPSTKALHPYAASARSSSSPDVG
jgi:hypothetical protein